VIGAPTAPAYSVAALRHHKDAQFLLSSERLPSADHLAGFAAECSLKSIFIELLGGRMKGVKPQLPGTGTQHLPGLWESVQVAASEGRASANVVSLLGANNPFVEWDISDRYGAGADIDRKRVQDHVDAATRLIVAYTEAKLSGALG
jgi:hypothetical protein